MVVDHFKKGFENMFYYSGKLSDGIGVVGDVITGTVEIYYYELLKLASETTHCFISVLLGVL